MSDSEEDYSSEEDEDYVPSEEDISEEDDDPGVVDEEVGGVQIGNKKNKQRKNEQPRKRKGGIKLDEDDEQAIKEEEEEEKKRQAELAKEIQKDEEKTKEEREKKKADDLWASFLKDVTPPAKPKQSASVGMATGQKTPTSCSSQQEKTSLVQSKEKKSDEAKDAKSKVTVTKVFDFAGEEVKVTEEVDVDSKEAKAFLKETEKPTEKSTEKPTTAGESSGKSQPNVLSRIGIGGSTSSPGLKRPGGGLSGILGKIGKKPKMSTLEKSRLDWKSFKEEEGIEDELTQHNRGKEGYLEKQAFLERTDLRQFEAEKKMRLENTNR